MKPLPLYIVLFLLLTSCKESPSPYHLPTYSPKGHLHAVIEIPAGTNHKIEINPKTGVFENDIQDGKVRIVKFLPYPGNYGFIPSTYMDPTQGGDGDALDILVIAESVPTGTAMEVLLVGGLSIVDHGEIDTKLLGIPADPALQLIKEETLAGIQAKHPAALNIIRDWFVNYKNDSGVVFEGWLDEKAALKEVEKWK